MGGSLREGRASRFARRAMQEIAVSSAVSFYSCRQADTRCRRSPFDPTLGLELVETASERATKFPTVACPLADAWVDSNATGPRSLRPIGAYAPVGGGPSGECG